MAKKRSSNSSTSSFSTIVLFFLFIAVGISFYLNSQSMKRISQLESSYQSVINRMADLEYGGSGEDGGTARPRNVISLEQTGSSATIKESINKILTKSDFSVEGLLYCASAEEQDGNVTKVEALYFKGGLVSFYGVPTNTKINPQTLIEGRGKYTINGLDLLASLNLTDGGTQILNFKISELTTDQKGVLGISLSEGVIFRANDCEAFGVSI